MLTPSSRAEVIRERSAVRTRQPPGRHPNGFHIEKPPLKKRLGRVLAGNQSRRARTVKYHTSILVQLILSPHAKMSFINVFCFGILSQSRLDEDNDYRMIIPGCARDLVGGGILEPKPLVLRKRSPSQLLIRFLRCSDPHRLNDARRGSAQERRIHTYATSAARARITAFPAASYFSARGSPTGRSLIKYIVRIPTPAPNSSSATSNGLAASQNGQRESVEMIKRSCPPSLASANIGRQIRSPTPRSRGADSGHCHKSVELCQ